MLILGIESSCDETAAGVLEVNRGKFVVRSNVVHSQLAIHRRTGGVVPEIAARAHVDWIMPVITKALQQANVTLDSIDRIAVNRGPGLVTSLLVGVETARALALTKKIPLVGTNHLFGHMAVNQLPPNQPLTARDFPALCLVVSGGHTELILLRDWQHWQKLGATLDDAAGECFDKAAKLAGLPYPGGPVIAKLAINGNPTAIALPRPMLNKPGYDFSFSGLKTAVKYHLRDHGVPEGKAMNDLCASIQQTIIDVLVGKTIRAAKQYRVKTVLLGGGVSANRALREQLASAVAALPSTNFMAPNLNYCTDNSMLAAVAGYYTPVRTSGWHGVKVDPNLSL